MGSLRLSTAGESHGPAEICILEGVPAGLPLRPEDVDRDLARRQRGFGRGGRMQLETDRVTFLAGVRLGRTLGSPVAMLVANADHANWRPSMQPEPKEGWAAEPVTVPRPGHADLAGVAKTGHDDVRNVLERSSARDTVARVAAGAVAKVLLAALGATVRGRVLAVGGVRAQDTADMRDPGSVDWDRVEASAFGCADPEAETAMVAAVEKARDCGESLGGVFEIWAWGVPPGLGGYATPASRLDGRLLGAVGSIPAVKGVEIGLGFAAAALPGSEVHDPIVLGENRGGAARAFLRRASNRAGGLEGGMTNGLPVIVRAAMKPIPTLMRPLPSVDLATMRAVDAHKERSDVEAVAAARVVGEAMVALELASAYLEKFGGDGMGELRRTVAAYEAELEERGLWRRS
ncbi:MAG: chorismate synthase [Actinobacteria bacterium]|nr:chorismate synthase [Actinomycetota bacterium]